ncbi:SCO family protein [Sphingoaurantiacus capsulatus]|uniref:SCO family protein n=1 Tax=Sphingoaurantiacus capsulatus TaxID=1771310 RepID=A0ABV7XDY0_9SPHN
MPATDLRRVRRWLWAAVALVAVAASVALWRPAPKNQVAEDYASAFGGPFSLTDTQGRTVTDATLRGKPFAIFFGFTHCPDVCPTTLQMMVRLRQNLGADGDRLNIVFVSVDPERDTPAEIGHYLTMFDTPIIGLTGNPAQLKAIVDAYHVFYEKVPIEGGDYVVDHTASVFLMDADGRFFSTLDHKEGEAPKLAKLKRLLREG